MVFQLVKELKSIVKILMRNYRQRLLKCRRKSNLLDVRVTSQEKQNLGRKIVVELKRRNCLDAQIVLFEKF